MKDLWYVSVASASTAAAPRRMTDFRLTRLAARALLAAVAAPLGCSGSVARGPRRATVGGTAPPRREDRARATPTWPARAARAGRPAPAATATGGRGEPAARRAAQAVRDPPRRTAAAPTLDSPTLGHFAGGADEACFYIDVLPGRRRTSSSRARGDKEGGVGRRSTSPSTDRRARGGTTS
jgi:hypothetical protein